MRRSTEPALCDSKRSAIFMARRGSRRMEPGYVLLVRTNQLPFPVAAVLTLLLRLPRRRARAGQNHRRPRPDTTASAAPSSPAGPASSGARCERRDRGIGAPKDRVCSEQRPTRASSRQRFLTSTPGAATRHPPAKWASSRGMGRFGRSKGDCEFAAGISCHFHTAMEFVSSTKSRDHGCALGEIMAPRAVVGCEQPDAALTFAARRAPRSAERGPARRRSSTSSTPLIAAATGSAATTAPSRSR